ncbi:MAG TPA: hypothetical protein VN408_08230 [Actinoplanes sp.]|nr:hypothetical protein [Actinoplanes sp.]
MTGLERRYRRLLLVYPAAHRAGYQEEMIAVLMSGTDPGRRFPSPADALDLVRAGLSARLGSAFHTQRGTGWRAAAAVVALLASVVMTGTAVERLIEGLQRWAHGLDTALLAESAIRVVVWTLVVAAAVLGLRRTAAGLATAGVLVQVGTVLWWAGPAPWDALRLAWTPVLALVILGLFAAARRPVSVVLGFRGSMAVAGAVGLAATLHLVLYLPLGLPYFEGFRFLHLLPVLIMAVALLATTPPVRNRIAVLASVVIAIPVAFNTQEQLAHWGWYFDLTPGILGGGVAVLVLTPVTVFAVGLTVLRVSERFAGRRAGHLRAHE